MEIKNPYDGMKEFVFENVCALSESEVLSLLGVTASEAVLPIDGNSEERETFQTAFVRKEGGKYRVKAGDTVQSIADKFSVGTDKINFGEDDFLYPCKIVYVKK